MENGSWRYMLIIMGKMWIKGNREIFGRDIGERKDRRRDVR